MVTRRSAGFFLAGLIFTLLACGTADEKVVDVNLILPVGWESVIDMDVLGAESLTPYIGTIRFLHNGATYEFPYDKHTASIDVGETDGDLTVQAVTAGQVIMEGRVAGLGSASGGVTVTLEKANGFSEAGSLLFPRLNHSAVPVNGVVYLVGGNAATGVIEAVASSGGGFVSSAYAASLVYPRDKTTVLHDPAGDQLFVFKGALAVGDNLYEIVDLENELVVPRVFSNPRFNYFPILVDQEILLLGGDDGISTWFENTLLIDAQNLSEQIWTGLGTSLVRDEPICLSDSIKLSCFGGNTEIVEVFDLFSGVIDYSLSILPNMYGFTATLLENGDVVIVGGIEGATTLSEVKLFKPYTGDFSALGAGLIYPRNFHTSTLLSNDHLLIIGGGPTVDSSHTAELLNLTTGESTLLPWRMTVPRVGHTATLLPDGRVLVTGGSATDRTIEVWNPWIN